MKKIISILLAILMLLTCLIGCADEGDTENTNNSVSTDAEADDLPDIPKQDNNNEEFNILYPKWSLYENYYFSDGIKGDVVGDQNYTRQTLVEEHLGIKIVPIVTTNDAFGGVVDVINKIKTATLSGTEEYQMALTHCFNVLASAACEGHFANFEEIPNIDLEAEYWRGTQMRSVAIQNSLYFGTGSFIIPDPNVMLFNKGIVDSYPDISTEALYQSVLDKTWTLEKMKLYASHVSTDENAEDGSGMYGFTTVGDWEIIAFMTSEGYYTATQDSKGDYTLLDFNEKIDDICRAVDSLVKANYSYSCTLDEKDALMAGADAMFATAGLSSCISTVSSSSSQIGILPYPSISEGVEHQNLDWAGYMVIPSIVEDKALAGSVAELLCYYGEKNVYPAFYDKLLGLRTAENFRDAEMLDLIFDTLVLDPGLAFLDGALTQLGYIFYVIPKTVYADGEVNVASYFEKYYKTAKLQLDFDLY